MRARRGRSVVLDLMLTVSLAAAIAVWPALASAETTSEVSTDTSGSLTAAALEDEAGPHSLVGSYLAGRLARGQFENNAAAEFYRNALRRDPGNDVLLEQAYLLEASEGNWQAASKHAEDLVALQPQHRMARLFLGLQEFRSGSYKKAEEHFKASASGPIGELTSALALAWVKQAEGNSTAALAALDVPKQAEWAQFYLRYHRALVADVAGRQPDARAAYEKVFRQDAKTLRTALAYARHAMRAGDSKLAKTVLKEHLDKNQGDEHPLARDLLRQIDAKQPIGLLVASPADGLAEVFYGLGEALAGEGGVNIGVLYLQMALYLKPDQSFALAALANALETTKNYDAAISVYDRIEKGSPLQSSIEIRKAFNLNSLEKVDAARDTLLKLLDGGSAPAAAPAGAAAAEPAPVTPPSAGNLGPVPTEAQPLRVGSKDARVRKLQEALKRQGYTSGEPDGAFGDATRKAVMAFQRAKGIKPDGLVGPATYMAVLGEGDALAPVAASTSPAATTPAASTSAPPAGGKLDVQTQLQALDALGNIMRAHKLYGEAITYYDRAIGLIPKPERRHWAYYYARGTSHERMKNWPLAELDLQKALDLYPDQPLVLNYLGYSWIDQGRNLKQGMTLIEKAVALKPDDGYIVDSLGWAHFRQGNYKDAVRYLERAVELKPEDPVLNDHLGDALWRVGREREARFQWDQSLSLKPEPEDEAKIKKKLESGLEAPSQAAPEKKNKEVQGEAAVRKRVSRAQAPAAQ